jgi:hypothetical protein
VVRRVQRADRTWRYVVEVEVPAGAVTPIPGVDYGGVPTERVAPELVMRPTPATADQARIFLDQGWAIRCTTCKPLPTAP